MRHEPPAIDAVPVQEYLNERRRLGFALIIPGTQLMSFARFADRIGHRGPLTCQIIVDWAQGQAKRATPLTWAQRLRRVIPFARYRAQFDPNTEVPGADTFGPSSRRLAPHIYTEEEIAELLAAASRLPPNGTLRPATYSTLFGLIAATGLRISEALHLQCADVNLANGTLTVRETKFSKSRLVPLHPTVTKAMIQYASLCEQYVPRSPERRFFTLASGLGLVNRTVNQVFERLRKELGWAARGGYAMPRIHDLRHTFICRRVKLWHEQSADIDSAMVALSTYVGHAKVSNTYWYLTGVPELMAVAGSRFEQFASNPENGLA